jgi:hypothetical protein
MISEMMIKAPTHQSIAGFSDFPFALASDGLVCLVLIGESTTCRIVEGDLPTCPISLQMTQRACSGTPTVELPLLIAARV